MLQWNDKIRRRAGERGLLGSEIPRRENNATVLVNACYNFGLVCFSFLLLNYVMGALVPGTLVNSPSEADPLCWKTQEEPGLVTLTQIWVPSCLYR